MNLLQLTLALLSLYGNTPFGDSIHEGIFHPSLDSLFSFLGPLDSLSSASSTGSSIVGEVGRALIKTTIQWATQFTNSKPFVRSALSTEYPYWRFIPLYISSAVPNAGEVSWSAPCFQESSAVVTAAEAGTFSLVLTLGKPTSLSCQESYMFGTLEGIKIETFSSAGSHSLTWSPAADVRPAELWDINNRGIRIFRFTEDTMTATVADILDTALLFTPMLTKQPGADAERRNIDFLAKYTQTYFMNPRSVQTVPVDESLIHSGDFFGIMRLDGLDPMLAWAMGSATGHVTVAIRVDGELMVAESTTASAYWPTSGIQMTPYQKWIQHAQEAGYNMLWAPLTEEQRQKFNETAALEYFRSVEGVEYGYYNIIMSWLDTPTANYPCLPPDFSLCFTWSHAEILMGLIDRISPTLSDLLFNQALNHRIGRNASSMLRPAEVFQFVNETASQLGLNDISELPTIPEQDEWTYATHRYNESVVAPSSVCCVFVCHMWKAGGLFQDAPINNQINCGELTNGDDYFINILDDYSTKERPQQCKEADPDNQLCQLEGKYTVTFLNYSSRDVTPHMAEKCPSLPPRYDRPLGC